ncbi:conserved hypothetical protein [Pediculus humanus corporis]|uniref:DUF1279 domain-containing protein n=1 Tax=Pediculus humanus subsp. corporis TaxID=121224 RepID=E0VR84_PEDHC|nr:uncharacterized protein Phum_PHUM394580 [Pediculus humanus corporis]EEB15890.1 conserved hypothetical protein [Pediculus humanus corporis]
MYKEYWYVLIPVHLITSSIWFGGFYYLAASGIDIPALLESMGAPDSWVQNLKNSKAGNLVLAYTLYKVVTPVRYTITVGGTTISINYLKKYGLVKPVPNREQIKKMYQQQKGAFKDFTTSKMQVTKDEFLKNATDELHKSLYETRSEFSNFTKTVKEEHAPLVRALKKTFNSVIGKK